MGGDKKKWAADNKEHIKTYNKAYWNQSPTFRRSYQLKRKYGITLEDYDRMFKDQEGVCAICRRFDPQKQNGGKLYVDHNHATGKVRGLLCGRCNTSLHLYDDRLKEVFAYLGVDPCPSTPLTI